MGYPEDKFRWNGYVLIIRPLETVYELRAWEGRKEQIMSRRLSQTPIIQKYGIWQLKELYIAHGHTASSCTSAGLVKSADSLIISGPG